MVADLAHKSTFCCMTEGTSTLTPTDFRKPGLRSIDHFQHWIVRVTGFPFGVVGRRIGLVQWRVEFEAPRQVRVGDKQLTPSDGICFTCIEYLLCRFPGELLVRDVRTAERGFQLRTETLVAERFARGDKRDLAL